MTAPTPPLLNPHPPPPQSQGLDQQLTLFARNTETELEDVKNARILILKHYMYVYVYNCDHCMTDLIPSVPLS